LRHDAVAAIMNVRWNYEGVLLKRDIPFALRLEEGADFEENDEADDIEVILPV